MISRRSLITKAPVAAAAVAGGGLLLPSLASAHDEGEIDVTAGPTNLQEAWVPDFVLTGGGVNVKSWEQDGKKAVIFRENSSSGRILGRGIMHDDHADVWWEGKHHDLYAANMEDRRRKLDSVPNLEDLRFMGLDDTARFPDNNIFGNDNVQYRAVQSLASGAYYYVADYFRPDAGWRRKFFSAAAIGLIAEVTANLVALDLELAVATATLVGVETGFAVSCIATGGLWAATGAGFAVAAVIIYGAKRGEILSKRMAQSDRLYPEFLAGSFVPTAAGTDLAWPEG